MSWYWNAYFLYTLFKKPWEYYIFYKSLNSRGLRLITRALMAPPFFDSRLLYLFMLLHLSVFFFYGPHVVIPDVVVLKTEDDKPGNENYIEVVTEGA